MARVQYLLQRRDSARVKALAHGIVVMECERPEQIELNVRRLLSNEGVTKVHPRALAVPSVGRKNTVDLLIEIGNFEQQADLIAACVGKLTNVCTLHNYQHNLL